VKRRDFLAAGATLAAAAGVGRTARAQPALPVGDFLLARSGRVLTVAHRAEPDRVLWETDPQGNFLAA
jgi:hypothetical protein